MNNTIIAVVAATFAVTGTVAALAYVRRNNLKKKIIESTEQIEGELQFEDVVSYFRGLDLNQDVDIPFIANCESEKFKKMGKGFISSKPGYNILMIGVVNSLTNEISHFKYVYSLGWSEQLSLIMGDETCVVLT